MVRGDETAYHRFHELYFPRLYRYLLVVAAGDEEAARDAVQSTFLRVVRYAKPFDDAATLWNWLTVLARTALADQRRKVSRYRAFIERFTGHARVESDVAPAAPGHPEAPLLAALEQGLDGLLPEERNLVERKYFARESVRDIALALGIGEKAVESRLTRVRLKLRTEVLIQLKNESPD
jgi:RNA polymerase sigma-70 factor (ECF subfamily)